VAIAAILALAMLGWPVMMVLKPLVEQAVKTLKSASG
jgi:hypothetical protein